jgi:hypothetical protein
MLTIRSADLPAVARQQGGLRVSIYTPVHRSQPDSKQDAPRLANLIKQAGAELQRRGWKRPQIEKLLEGCSQLADNSVFWRSPAGKGLCLLAAPEEDLRFAWSSAPFAELLAVDERFHLGPLIDALSVPSEFRVLCLSENTVRLFRGDRQKLYELKLPKEAPLSLREALEGTEFDQGLQRHTTAPTGAPGVPATVVHGHGSPKDEQKTLTTEYLRAVLRHLDPLIRQDPSPLVLVAVDSMQAIVRDLWHPQPLLKEGVTGSPDELHPTRIHRQALELVDRERQAMVADAIGRYQRLAGTGRVALHLEPVVSAALAGRVETIFAARGAHVWGSSDGDRIAIHAIREAQDTDLLDLAVCRTMADDGQAFIVDRSQVPSGDLVAAILRW